MYQCSDGWQIILLQASVLVPKGLNEGSQASRGRGMPGTDLKRDPSRRVGSDGG
jgi:hypothetical protein